MAARDTSTKKKSRNHKSTGDDDNDDDVDLFENDSALSKKGIFIISSVIERDVADDISASVIKLHYGNRFNDDIQLILNSPGGDYWAGMGLLNILKFSRFKLRTIGIGENCSMGSFLLIAGDERIVTENSLTMFHNFSETYYGTVPYDDLVARRKPHDHTSNQIVKHVMKYSKFKTEEEVRKYIITGRDVFLSAQEMLDYGLCDKIISK